MTEKSSPSHSKSRSPSSNRTLSSEIGSSEFAHPKSRGTKAIKTVSHPQFTHETSPREHPCNQKSSPRNYGGLLVIKKPSQTELQEINPGDFKDNKQPPEIVSRQSNPSTNQLPMPRPVFRKETRRRIEESYMPNFPRNPYFDSYGFNVTAGESTFYEDKKREWWSQGEYENPVNCVVAYNLESRVDEEMIYELFCKVGKIKKMKLYRFSNRDIDGSPYLQTLNLSNHIARPHKKRALIEYHAPNYAEAAVKVFNKLELYHRKIYVMKYQRDFIDHQIHFVKPNQVLPWFDQYFCLDYFTRITDVTRIFVKPEINNNSIRIMIHFPTSKGFEQAKQALQDDLRRYFKDKVLIYFRASSKAQERKETSSPPPVNLDLQKSKDVVNIDIEDPDL